MKVALDFTFDLVGGTVIYLKEMIRFIPEIDQENEYLLLVSDKGYELVSDLLPQSNIKCKILPHLKNPLYHFLWEQISLPLLLEKEQVDILFNVNSRAPLRKLKCKKVILIGTLGPFINDFIKCLNYAEQIKIKILSRLIVTSIKLNDITIFESEYTRDLLVEKYGIKGEFRINHHGRPIFNRGDYSLESINEVKNRYGLMNDYFLYVTDLRKYKNIERLIKAYAKIQKHLKEPTDFVIAGKIISRSYFNEIMDLCSTYEVKDSFHFLGGVDFFTHLKPLSLGCIGFVFPTKYENLSYALVEALTYGLPIITSTGTAMPETCGDAALYFKPEDTGELADAMLLLANDSDLRESLKVKSLKRALNFKDMREEILYNIDIFKQVMHGKD
tara:strand:- start:364 stop:1524 length:1161 start_codon:yes stop_codon:yes gene_type:complete